MSSAFTMSQQDDINFTDQSQWFRDVIGYANSVVSGEKLACIEEKAACSKFLNDYQTSLENSDFEYEFSFKKAYRVIGFIELLPHVKGHLASRPGKERLIVLAPWQKFIIANIFGWIRKDNGLRRYSLIYLRVPRKNGKSTLSAGIGLYMLCADDESGAEVLCGATKLDQAKKVYEPALQMVRTRPGIRKFYKLDPKAKSISRPDGSVMEPLVGDPGDGGNPSCAIIDEYHEHDTDTLYQTMLTGMGARLQPLMLVITTSGKNLFSPCYDLDKTACDVLAGVYDLPHMFAVCYGIDKEDDWQDPQMLIKANPNYGISVGQDFVKQQLKTAIQKASYQVDYKTKHLNIWCNQKAAYYNLMAWQNCYAQDMKLDDYLGNVCWIGLDLAKVRDLSCKVIIFREWYDGGQMLFDKVASKGWHYFIFSRFYICEAQIEDNDNKTLQMLFMHWRNEGHIHVCEGNEQDFGLIRDEVIDDSHRFSVEEVPYDPSGATQISHELQDYGLLPVKIGQHGSFLTDPINELEAAIASERVHHDGNPIMDWCIGNVIVHTFPDGKKMPRKENDDSKIDGASALFCALNRAYTPDDSKPDVDGFINNIVKA